MICLGHWCIWTVALWPKSQSTTIERSAKGSMGPWWHSRGTVLMKVALLIMFVLQAVNEYLAVKQECRESTINCWLLHQMWTPWTWKEKQHRHNGFSGVQDIGLVLALDEYSKRDAHASNSYEDDKKWCKPWVPHDEYLFVEYHKCLSEWIDNPFIGQVLHDEKKRQRIGQGWSTWVLWRNFLSVLSSHKVQEDVLNCCNLEYCRT